MKNDNPCFFMNCNHEVTRRLVAFDREEARTSLLLPAVAGAPSALRCSLWGTAADLERKRLLPIHIKLASAAQPASRGD